MGIKSTCLTRKNLKLENSKDHNKGHANELLFDEEETTT